MSENENQVYLRTGLIDRMCRDQARKVYDNCVADIEKTEKIFTGTCVSGSIIAGIGAGLLSTPAAGLAVGGLGIAGCLTVDLESVGFTAGKAECGFLSRRIYDACMASK